MHQISTLTERRFFMAYILKIFSNLLILISLVFTSFAYSLHVVIPAQFFQSFYEEIKEEQARKQKEAYTQFLKDFLEEEQCIIRSNAKKQEIEICLEYAYITSL